MSKRRNDDELPKSTAPKRPRATRSEHISDKFDHLSALSNEVLLHILSFLPIPSLLTCQRLSRRFYDLAGDSELWKRQYFSKWVRPRARRLAISRCTSFPSLKLEYSPRVSTWLDHGHLDRSDRITDWKRQYQLRHNWSKGICRVTEVEIPQPRKSPILIAFCAGFVFTADLHGGLRVWSSESPHACKAGFPLEDSKTHAMSTPTALTATCGSEKSYIEVAVGFDDGRFRTYKMDTTRLWMEERSCSNSTCGAITAMSSSYPYLLVISKHMVLSLYKMPLELPGTSWPDDVHLVASLKADSILSPMSLSVRLAGSEIIASIVYSFFRLGCGWSLGIQELRFDEAGLQIDSRLTTTVDTQYGVAHLHNFPGIKHGQSSTTQDEDSTCVSRSSARDPTILHQDPPTSVSYSHPYLLTSHADNTLTVYLLVSTSDRLFVKGGQRLWGHTSSVSAVQVSDRGKAVSVSSRGDEVRIWELESLISSFGSHKVSQGDKSIKVKPENQRCSRSGAIESFPGDRRHEIDRARSPSLVIPNKFPQERGCIGFDEERLLLLREREYGTQLLEFYDFS
ncbi:hypothetical protein BJX61DRAFT_537543 [Aspergillus egyptiacus]|nr:hypothetical protein BJX61DRAFT_537543 [Aspergillus egyptiacus]